MSNARRSSLIECSAHVEGVSTRKLRALISANALPERRESYRTLCKWPRHTAQGYDDRGEFWRATVTRIGDDILIYPSKKQANTAASGNDNTGSNLLVLLAIWVLLWVVTFAS